MSSKVPIALPAYTFHLRLAQFIIAVLVLILDIISSAILLGGYGALGYGIFTPIATCIIVAYWYFASYRSLQYYDRWAVLILDCFAVVWWLSLWAVMASWSATLGFIDSLDNTYGFNDLGNVKTTHALTAIAAVLGAAEFVLFVVSLVSFSVHLHRVRLSERQSMHHNQFATFDQTNNHSISSPEVVNPKGGFQASV